MKSHYENICQHFKLDDVITDVFEFGSGHIHDTFKVVGKKKIFILQRINQNVFKNIEGLTRNIVDVSHYLLKHGLPAPMQVLEPIPLIGMGYVFFDKEKKAWRMFNFIEGSQTYNHVSGPEIAKEGGHAFGRFLRALDGFPADKLVETIPGFHNVGFRLDYFLRAIENDVCYRVEFVSKEIEFIFDRANNMKKLESFFERGIIPRRVTHNDTKVNNLLFNNDNKAICVIDLDTLMPGYSIFDFGDAIRTFANLGHEDDKKLSHVGLSIENYTAFTYGYLSETRSILNSEEIDNLAFAAKYITYEQSLRFLIDYIEGDRYYKVNYPEHNLVRTRAQFKLLKSMEEHFDEMQHVISTFL